MRDVDSKPASNFNDSSDYGSEFDVDEAVELLDTLQAANLSLGGPLEGNRLPYDDAASSNASDSIGAQSTTTVQPADSSFLCIAPCTYTKWEGQFAVKESSDGSELVQPMHIQDDIRSPIERFRTPPNKPLSVTDIVSPAWCELQYLKNLQEYGRVRRTAAMKRGSEVHRFLEDEVHQAVPVEVQTREDHWGIKFWNAIQGLRTLRTTGLTREMEVWGIFEGQVVNGVIDKLSYTCKDPNLEDSLRDLTYRPKFGAHLNGRQDLGYTASAVHSDYTIHVTDVKTRAYSSLPKASNMRPARMQLMLYRKILLGMANRCIEPSPIFQRYNLSPAKPFSNSLVSQLRELETRVPENFGQLTIPVACEITRHNSLAQLWELLVTEFTLSIPQGVESISEVLNVEFRYRETGEVLGYRNFLYDEEEISNYLADELKWWRGERETKGVEIEEAFKCSTCEFAENCAWRLGKIEKAAKNSKRH